MKITILISLVSSLALANTQPPRSVSVNGQCEIKVPADRASVTLVAQFTEKQSMTASKKASEMYEKMRTEVQKLNLKDLELQTTESTLQEQFDYSMNKRTSTGFQASMGLRVSTSDIKKIGEVVALNQKLQIQRTENLVTYLSDEKAKSARESCLVIAVKNAKEKAQKMAEALQSKIGEPLLIQEGGNSRPMPMPFHETAAMMADVSTRGMKTAPTIDSKEQVISVDVQVQFALKN